jgi:tetratricopeptide (TPR) repeat protein
MQRVTLEQALQLAHAHLRAGRSHDARHLLEQIVAAHPTHAGALFQLGDLVLRHGDAAGAVPLLQRAVDLNPRLTDFLTRLGFALLGMQRIDDAAAAFERAIAIDPAAPNPHYGLSWTLLARGDFGCGLVEHEWRAQCNTLPGQVRTFSEPRWDGSDLAGKRILLYQEQGLGDVIHFVRYAPLVALRGGRVVLGCPDALGKLLIHTPGIAEVAPAPDRLPPFDVHCPLHSLPLIFKTTLDTIPADVPYVFPPADAVEQWRRRFDRSSRALHVGICWAGSAKHENDRLRSIDPAELARLADVPNVRFYALQKDLSIEQARRLPNKPSLIDLGPDLKDFVQTAAAIANLDLIISVDTSIAHLAGASAKPVWTLLPFHADWRWLLHRQDSPWYPTMRLFRQPAAHDWPSVLNRVAAELKAMATT